MKKLLALSLFSIVIAMTSLASSARANDATLAAGDDVLMLRGGGGGGGGHSGGGGGGGGHSGGGGHGGGGGFPGGGHGGGGHGGGGGTPGGGHGGGGHPGGGHGGGHGGGGHGGGGGPFPPSGPNEPPIPNDPNQPIPNQPPNQPNEPIPNQPVSDLCNSVYAGNFASDNSAAQLQVSGSFIVLYAQNTSFNGTGQCTNDSATTATFQYTLDDSKNYGFTGTITQDADGSATLKATEVKNGKAIDQLVMKR